jgi:hypothetical protein
LRDLKNIYKFGYLFTWGESVTVNLDRKKMWKCETYSFETGWGPVAGLG